MKSRRLKPNDRKILILDAAVSLSKQGRGYIDLSRSNVAKAAGVSPGLVCKYFPAMKDLKKAVMKTAIEQELLPVIAQGLAVSDPIARNAPQEIRTKAIIALGVS